MALEAIEDFPFFSKNSKFGKYSFFQNIVSIHPYLEKEELRFLIYSYETQLDMALEGFSELEPETLWENFKLELKEHLSSPTNSNN